MVAWCSLKVVGTCRAAENHQICDFPGYRCICIDSALCCRIAYLGARGQDYGYDGLDRLLHSIFVCRGTASMLPSMRSNWIYITDTHSYCGPKASKTALAPFCELWVRFNNNASATLCLLIQFIKWLQVCINHVCDVHQRRGLSVCSVIVFYINIEVLIVFYAYYNIIYIYFLTQQ